MAGSIETLAAELRQSAEDEAQVRNRLEAVVGGMGEALLAVGPDGRIATFNGAAEQLFGVPAHRALGRVVGSVARVTTEDGADLSARLAEPPKDGWNASAVVLRPDGLPVPVALSAEGLRGPDDEVVGGVYVLRDMRREREAERAKSELLSNISHELRTPLVPIKGYAELLLRRDVPPDKARESLEEIVEAADRLEIVVQRLLDVAAQEASPRDVRCDRVPVEPLLDAVVERWKDRVDTKHPITQSVPRQIPDLMGDRELLERCFDELIDNAIKFSPEGERSPSRPRAFENGNGSKIDITVRDHGIGIPPDRQGGHLRGLRPGRQLAHPRVRGAGAGAGPGAAHRRRPQRRAEVRDRARGRLPVLGDPPRGPAPAPQGPALMRPRLAGAAARGSRRSVGVWRLLFGVGVRRRGRRATRPAGSPSTAGPRSVRRARTSARSGARRRSSSASGSTCARAPPSSACPGRATAQLELRAGSDVELGADVRVGPDGQAGAARRRRPGHHRLLRAAGVGRRRRSRRARRGPGLERPFGRRQQLHR